MFELPAWQWGLVGVFALVGSLLSAVSGFGSAAVLLPVLALALGEKDAVPVLTIAQIVGNASKGWFNRREIRWSTVRWYLLGAIPAAILGSLVFVAVPARILSALMGAFLVLAVVWRRWKRRPEEMAAMESEPLSDRRLSLVGLFTGLLSALVGGAGPIAAPFFLAAGLVKGAYLGTEAIASMGVHLAKLATFGGTGVLSWLTFWIGLALAPLMIAGAWWGKRIVDRISKQTFVLIVECSLIAGATLMFWRAAIG